jgi:hypothetical protein
MILAAWSFTRHLIGAGGERSSPPHIPEDKKIICLLPIGVPAETPDPKPRREFGEVFHAEKYGKPLNL